MSNLFRILTWPFYLYGKFHASRYGNLLTHLGNLCYAAFLRGQLSKSDNLLSFGRNIRFVGTKYISLGKNVSLCDLDTLVEVAADKAYIAPEDKERLIKFRNNPSDESWMA